MDASFEQRFTGVMSNFFTRMLHGLENLTINDIKIKDGIILLDYIEQSEQVSMTEIKQFLDTNPSTATRRVDNLVEHELVDRIIDPPDRRNVLIEITDKGKSILNKFFSNRIALLGQFMQTVEKEKLENFIEIVESFMNFTNSEGSTLPTDL